MSLNNIDTIHMQVMWNRLISVVEEQAMALIRTAFSTSVREAGDLSAGIFDKRGRMLAQAVTGTPGHVNTMAEAVEHFMNEIGVERMYEGDVYLTNDPWRGTGHLHDFTVVSPSFLDGELIGYFASTAHVVDIGGRGFGPDSREVYEEGLFVPIMKLIERREVNRDLVNIIRNNVREADKVVGDLYALASCNETGHKRLLEMLREFGLTNVDGIGEFILARSREATLERIAALPKGTQTNEMTLDGYDEPVRLNVTLTVADDHLLADFAGSSPASPFGINVPLPYAKAYACYGLKCIIAPEVPNNAASLEPFRVQAPAGCILNAQRPSPVAVRHVLGHFVPDLVLGALDKILPNRVPAEGAGALWNLHVSARPVNEASGLKGAEILMFNSGGTGARAQLDGLSATAFPSGVHAMSVEATEQVGPIVVWRKEMRSGSGGAGKHRGGLGQVVEIGPRSGYEFRFNAMFDRIDHPARGHAGGQAGAAGQVALSDGTKMKGKGTQAVGEYQRVVLSLPGGGGVGSPEQRSKEELLRDIRNEYISEAQLSADYGITLDALNASATR
ncbi:hydantoinase B/oxoprolinase family protein [Burkholderia multivorans]|uniref:5-oxoprolinase n=1 Tax=Burkholderia multivorans TaxID=87883 RepID=A0AB37AQE0_9BURK|nr:hydantoinase B/oxoprolinase family protein [Burkholderia multivorans]MBU9133462.1 hydantoinase B/oxoprolinase family protein [Burkholderia multivorans]MBU9224795.1 hydantoinase B/oxoprolinase family protein [Burkholderia multivorans]MBU9420519.1 hydantoinase B/oxoprolinase family protein [Burkholderia multivorans]MBU9479645.1 hydantoinase B/oxoprolinase family protein [Burkholderia multivorans]PRE45703.1 5-oxoprolinase [Burkholderia multivorans]